MDPLHTIRRRVVILTAGFLALLLVLWLLTPYKKMVAGAGLGLLVSLYNVLYMARKVRQAGETTLATGSTRHRGTGMINRYLMVALAILVAFKYPMHFDVRTIVVGLPICYILIIVLEFWEVRKLRTTSGKG
ncbi:ATP synthase I subunit [Laceyella sacchari]|uniref:ATP synthase subunit I n=1 Tax=Laceyella sacchari TaxID=37482 RepID=UPI0010456C97|nr:ATP synthase subunit I [Laceyella sacchari]TCW39261.1 ATP synthase I subunit [Laceyella sacchari]